MLALLASYIVFHTSLLNREVNINNSGTESEEGWFKRFTNKLFFNETPANEIDKDYVMPEKEANRLDILVLGVRGENDENATDGGLLTDTMMLFSHDKETGRSSLVSIPRDFYVKIGDGKAKINEAYEYGYYRRQGLNYVKELVSKITGVYVDHALLIDFQAFSQLVDQLDGITITLNQPFREEGQWGYVFELPAGENTLNGEQALYYVRSRYSTSDFDRAGRQQQVIFAIKNKITAMNWLTDPVKALSVLNTLNKNIETDIDIWNVKGMLDLARSIDTSPGMFRRQVLSTNNLLYQTYADNGAYILLPQGDNFDQIKAFFKSIINPPTPTPAPSSSSAN